MLHALCVSYYPARSPGIPITCRANVDARRKAAEAESIEI